MKILSIDTASNICTVAILEDYECKEEIIVKLVEGKNIEIGFNPKYFLDALKVIDDEEIFVEFGTNISPCIIRPVENEDYVYMILPIRLRED